MPDGRIRPADVQRTVARLRESRDADPERFEALGLLLDEPPAEDYDPDETPDDRDAS